ncbi:hypothetical protein [Streptantibioticus silvisoli]|uniref:hypothetical protein n=1 Tax=Streptantibioticus silvisoli TaxID=2705255 RepID=UPI003556CACD
MARIIAVIADVAALILIGWIVLYILKANTGNEVVGWVHSTADWLSGWSHDIFTPNSKWLRVLLNYGIAAAVYLFIGNLLAGRIRRA